ncbi:YcjX family protein [Escherichia coli]
MTLAFRPFYLEGLAQLSGDPPAWPTPTRGVSEIRLALRYKIERFAAAPL